MYIHSLKEFFVTCLLLSQPQEIFFYKQFVNSCRDKVHRGRNGEGVGRVWSSGWCRWISMDAKDLY